MPGAANPFAIGSQIWPGIAKLSEELGELLQICGKIVAFPDLRRGDTHPDGSDLVERLEKELGDVLAACRFIIEANGADELRIDERMQMKLARFHAWHDNERIRQAGGNPHHLDSCACVLDYKKECNCYEGE